MANTPQAKKRIRRNATRETINHSRVSRIRTFIKAVELAIESGKKADAAEALKQVQPEIARGVARGVIHKNTAVAEIFPAVQAGCVARLKVPLKDGFVTGRRETGGSSRFWTVKKMQQFRRFARPLTRELTIKMAVFRHFSQLSALFLCQVPLFHFREKSALASWPPTISNRSFRARIRAGGKREKNRRARDSVARDGIVLSCGLGVRRGRRGASARRRGKFVC